VKLSIPSTQITAADPKGVSSSQAETFSVEWFAADSMIEAPWSAESSPLLSAPVGTTRPRAARPRRPRQSTTIFGYPCRPPRFHLRLNEKRAQGADVPDGPDVALRRIGSYSQCSTRSPVSTPHRSASSWQAFGNCRRQGTH